MIPPVAPGQTEEKHNMVGWKNTFNMRQISLMNLAATQMGVKNSIKSIPSYRRAYSITSPAKSLDLLRKNLQNAINKDIDNVIKKYLEKFFQPAICNIRNNLGKDSVGDDHIKDVCKQMLEDAKLMYKTSQNSRDSSPYDYSDSEASLIEGKLGRGSPIYGKRKESDTDSETNHPLTHKKHRSRNTHTTDYSNYKLPIKREGPKWNPNRIHENTLFIMGARANKVLGYGQTRGRLYVRHPNLVRYSGDQEDKEWLASKNLMPPSGGKAYLMLLEDIKELTESDDYKLNPNLQLHELKGFEVPMFLLMKITAFIEHVRTDKKPLANLDIFEFRSHSVTPPCTILDSDPSPPPILPESTSSKIESRYINIPEMSPNSNNSIISSTLTHSPLPSSSTIMSPNMLMTLSNQENCKSNMMILKENVQTDNCLSSILASHVNSDNSQEF